MTSFVKECPYCHLAIDISPNTPQSICPFCGESLSYSTEEMKYFQVANNSLLISETDNSTSNNSIVDLATHKLNKKRNYPYTILWLVTLIVVGLCVYFIPKIFQTSTTAVVSGPANNSNSQRVVQITAPATSDNYKGRKYPEVVMDFENAGFTNVHPYPLYDKHFNLFSVDIDEVESISIGGNPDYNTSTLYPSDVYVKIAYHCWAKDKK